MVDGVALLRDLALRSVDALVRPALPHWLGLMKATIFGLGLRNRRTMPYEFLIQAELDVLN